MSENSLERLRQRFAEGEIDQEEFDRKKELLEETREPSGQKVSGSSSSGFNEVLMRGSVIRNVDERVQGITMLVWFISMPIALLLGGNISWDMIRYGRNPGTVSAFQFLIIAVVGFLPAGIAGAIAREYYSDES